VETEKGSQWAALFLYLVLIGPDGPLREEGRQA